jgi:DNA anti-recombination protein RmuC
VTDEERRRGLDNLTAQIEMFHDPASGVSGKLEDFLQGEIDKAKTKIVDALEEEIRSLQQLLQQGVDADDGYTDVHEIAGRVRKMADDTAYDVTQTLGQASDTCEERLEQMHVNLVEALDRWTAELNEAAQNAAGAFESLQETTGQAWSESSAQLQHYIADSGAALQTQVEAIKDRISQFAGRVEDAIQTLTTTQAAGTAAMGATQAPLQICLGIIDDTRAIFNDL